ncbi:MAG: lysophospholipase [Deltaproteobacteria bacterium]|nr:lysophospholipase [Deltaproteobacteria bacterium]
MTRRTETTMQAADGLSLRRVTWLPAEGVQTTGLVVLSHGLGEHVGRYDHVAEALNAAGIAMTGADHRGHGRSEGLRGHADGFVEYSRDVHLVVQAFMAEHPGLKCILYGHSMGGLIALSYNLDIANHPVAGFAVSNPQLGLAFEPPKVKAFAGRVLSRILPRVRLDNELKTADISRDPVEVSKYENDPLVSRLVSTRWFTSMNKATDAVNAAPERLTTPALFLLGGSDRICSAKASQAFAERLEASKTTVRLWPDSYHEPHNDLDRDEVISTLVGWVTEQTA